MKRTLTIIFMMFTVTINIFSQNSDNNKSISHVTGYLDVEGGKLYYETAGKGENIVLVHDGMIHSEIWEAQFPFLAKNYRVIRYDRRGYGKSPKPTAQYSNIEDLNRIFTQLKVDKAILFGMSAGGGLVIDFTLKYPEKVSAMVLVGSVVSGCRFTDHATTRGGRIKSPADIFSDPGKMIKYFVSEDPYTIFSENKQSKEKYRKLLEGNPQNINIDKYTFLKPAEKPAAKRLSEIKIPAIVLVGEYDLPDVHALSGIIENGIPNAKRKIISKAGHLIPFEQPEVFNDVVLKFLLYGSFKCILNEKGVDAAVKYYMESHAENPNIEIMGENEMNALGYDYLLNGKVKVAIELFKLNTIAFPKSANVWDSLGEAYMNAGNKELAIKNYNKSLELNPENKSAIENLKKLEK